MNVHAVHQSTWPDHLAAPSDRANARPSRANNPRPGANPLRTGVLLIAEFVWAVIYSAFTFTATVVAAIVAVLAVPIVGFVCVGLIGLALYLISLFLHGLGIV